MERLDKAIYYQTIWFIRRYWDLQDEYDAILNETPSHDGMSKTNNTGNNTTGSLNHIRKFFCKFFSKKKSNN